MIYNIDSTQLNSIYDYSGNQRYQPAYDMYGNEVFVASDIVYEAAHSENNIYAGGLLEIQPDSWDGAIVTGEHVDATDSTAWGFPMSLSSTSKRSIKNEIYAGNGYGVSFIRFPMGFAYRGYRNIDETTGLAKNIGERWDGQNEALSSWFSAISVIGGGLDVEYWCHAPHWLTGGAYYNSEVRNEICAGGSYDRTVTLSSIRESDPTQYAKQIDDLTDAIVNDLEYVHQNIAPVRMYTLGAEPSGSGWLRYGHCHWTSDVYNDVFAALHPKVMASTILATYRGRANVVLMHLCANGVGFNIGSDTITNHSDWIWGYSHDTNMAKITGELGIGADLIKDSTFPTTSAWENVFICEYEYYSTMVSDEQRCANNIVRMILEMAYRKAKIIMPIIHVCKPTGQVSAQSNTAGYCIYAVDMSDGSYTVNPWAYNSWKMFNDNLPIGAELVDGGDGGLTYAGYVRFSYQDKTYILLGNYADTAQSITLTFDTSKTFSGKLYNLTNIGTVQEDAEGTSITFTIPAYSGLVYVEE